MKVVVVLLLAPGLAWLSLSRRAHYTHLCGAVGPGMQRESSSSRGGGGGGGITFPSFHFSYGSPETTGLGLITLYGAS